MNLILLSACRLYNFIHTYTTDFVYLLFIAIIFRVGTLLYCDVNFATNYFALGFYCMETIFRMRKMQLKFATHICVFCEHVLLLYGGIEQNQKQ